MASQMYSRYIPPKRNKSVPVAPPAEALEVVVTSSIPPRPTPPSTKQDASSTYERYIPPPKSKPQMSFKAMISDIAVEPLPSVSKRKREELADSPSQASSKQAKKNRKDQKEFESTPISSNNLKDEGSTSTAIDDKPKKERKKTKKHEILLKHVTTENKPTKEISNVSSITKRTPLPDMDRDVDPRHRKLMEKRWKSLKKAEKLAKKAAKAATLAGDGEENAEPTPQEPQELHDLVPLPQPEPIPEPSTLSTLSSLPPWLASPIRVSQTASARFSELGIEEHVAKVLETKGFKEAFAVQAAVLPLLLPGASQEAGDILVSAATGSGKTMAYVLPMIEDICTKTVTRLRGLIVMPTRELVRQAKEVCEVCTVAFSGKGKKRVKIGTAVGSEAFKAEQALLMEQESRYDPAGYKEQQRRLNAKWESSDRESDGEEEILCQEEAVSTLPDHVIKPVLKIDILICTPGRLVEHLKSTPGFSLEYIKWLVVDEADKLLDQSFQQWLDIVMSHLGTRNPLSSSRSGDRVRKIILSATMTRDIGKLNSLKLYRPKLVVLEGSSNDKDGIRNDDEPSQSHVLPALLVEFAVKTDEESLKPLYLMELLRRKNMSSQIGQPRLESPSGSDSSSSEDESSGDEISSDDTSSATSTNSPKVDALKSEQRPSEIGEPRGILIFSKSNEMAVRLGRLIALIEPSYGDIIGTLTSSTSSSSRRRTLNLFNAGKLSILIASDLVSRGLDLPNLAHVINYDIPASITNYVHRVGRTARAGKSGSAWTLFTATEGRWFWNEIARSDDIWRPARAKVSRVNIDAELFDEEMRRRYGDALAELGKEAHSGSRLK